MRFALILILALIGTWLALSGFFKPLLLTLGAISIGIVIWMTVRMKILDKETAPYQTTGQTLIYFVWLFKEIIKANVAVVRAVMSPNLEVSPSLIKVPAKNKRDIAKTMFANSITLTPGTVSVDLQEDHILVHALLSEMSNPDDFQEMADKSAWAVGELDSERAAS